MTCSEIPTHWTAILHCKLNSSLDLQTSQLRGRLIWNNAGLSSSDPSLLQCIHTQDMYLHYWMQCKSLGTSLELFATWGHCHQRQLHHHKLLFQLIGSMCHLMIQTNCHHTNEQAHCGEMTSGDMLLSLLSSGEYEILPLFKHSKASHGGERSPEGSNSLLLA